MIHFAGQCRYVNKPTGKVFPWVCRLNRQAWSLSTTPEINKSQLRPENGCLAEFFLASISSTLGEFFMALAMAILVAS